MSADSAMSADTDSPLAPSSRPAPPAHGPAEALQSFLRSILIALFFVTFIAQPVVIPSESMEPTLLVGDFLLVNRIALAPDTHWRWLLGVHPPLRQQIVTFRSPIHPGQYLIKRIVAVPGDRLRIVADRVWIDGHLLNEPYLDQQSRSSAAALADFPVHSYTDPRMDLAWWRTLRPLVHGDQLTIPANQFFVLGDNRAHSLDSRYWGFVDRDQIVASPLLVYFSVRRSADPEQTAIPGIRAMPANDRLGHESGLFARMRSAVRWSRLFHIVHTP